MCSSSSPAARDQPRPLSEFCWSTLLEHAPTDRYVCAASCYLLPPPLVLRLFRSVLDLVRAKNTIFYSCQTVGHLSLEIRRTAQLKARENETILSEFLRFWPRPQLSLEQLHGLQRLAFLQESHPERDTWTLQALEPADRFVQRQVTRRVQEVKKDLLSAGCSLLRTFLKLLEPGGGGRRRLRQLDISCRLLSWVELFAVVGIVREAVVVGQDPDTRPVVCLGLRMDLSENRRMYAKRLQQMQLGGTDDAVQIQLVRVSVVSTGGDREEHRSNLALVSELLDSLGPAGVTSLCVQVDSAVPVSWLTQLVRRLPQLTELRLMLPRSAQVDDWDELLSAVCELPQLSRLALRCQLTRRLRKLLDELPGPLSSLCLPGCGLGPADLQQLALWPHLCQLQDLDLSGCGTDLPEDQQDACVHHLSLVVAQCCSLHTLLLDGAVCSTDLLPLLLRSVRTVETLERICFSGYPDRTQPDALIQLAPELVTLPHLRILTLTGFCREQIEELRADMQYWARVASGETSAPYIELRQQRPVGFWEQRSTNSL